MKKLLELFAKQNLLIQTAAFICALLLIIHVYHLITYTFITIKFDELRPFHERLDVFYKGFKIGRATKVMPSEDYKSTLIKVVLYPSNIRLPNNTTAKLKREKRRDKKVDFIELIYPSSPSLIYLKDGDLIMGKGTIDFESFFASQEPETLDAIRNDAANTIKSLQKTVDELGKLFIILQDVAQENRPNLIKTTGNLAQTSENIKDMTFKLNNSLKQDMLNNTFSNIDSSSDDVRNTVKNLQIISTNLDVFTQTLNTTMPTVNSSLTQTGSILKNLDEITCGISNTLKKRMGGLRLFFGKTIDEDCTDDCKK